MPISPECQPACVKVSRNLWGHTHWGLCESVAVVAVVVAGVNGPMHASASSKDGPNQDPYWVDTAPALGLSMDLTCVSIFLSCSYVTFWHPKYRGVEEGMEMMACRQGNRYGAEGARTGRQSGLQIGMGHRDIGKHGGYTLIRVHTDTCMDGAGHGMWRQKQMGPCWRQ